MPIKRRAEPPSLELLKSHFSYDPATGEFRHKLRRHGAKHGEIAGRLDGDGYRKLNLYGKEYFAHHCAWYLMKDIWLYSEIDHENRNPSDNSIDNLRPAGRSENRANSKRPVNNTSGYKGVVRVVSGKRFLWRASICKDGKRTFIGWYKTPELAGEAYLSVAKQMFGQYATAGD